MAKVLISVLVSPEMADKLDAKKKKTGISKSKLVDQALEMMFNKKPFLVPRGTNFEVENIEPGCIVHNAIHMQSCDEAVGD